MNIFEQLESEVRGYCRSFPVVFKTAKGATMTDVDGKQFLDFFAGAGVLNYGHNNDHLKQALIEYVSQDGITHALDMYSEAKQNFIERFDEVILQPRNMKYKLQFPGPTGTNAVEAALKLARKVTGRTRVVHFTNAFHGMTLGALAVTGNSGKRASAGVPLDNASALPFDGYLGENVNTLEVLDRMLSDAGSGIDKPAAVILETVQAEGGVKVCSFEWLKGLREITSKHDVLLIVDDIQVGCGRTGSFFSFEAAEIQPDIITLSKSLSGYGLPMALVLLKPEIDIWEPGEHNGTFRGHCPAFVTATKALDFWADGAFEKAIKGKEEIIVKRLNQAVEKTGTSAEVRGRGMIWGVAFEDAELAEEISATCFNKGLIIETAGIDDEVLKLLPSLTMNEDELNRGLNIIEEAMMEICK